MLRIKAGKEAVVGEKAFFALYIATFLSGALLIDIFAVQLRMQLSPVLFSVMALELVLFYPDRT